MPNCQSYDPAFAYELAVIVEDGIKRMYQDQEDIFYYLTVMNEQYHASADAAGLARRHPQGDVRVQADQPAEGEAARRSCSAAAPSSARR